MSGTWQCLNCETVNEDGTASCVVCDVPRRAFRPGVAMAPGQGGPEDDVAAVPPGVTAPSEPPSPTGRRGVVLVGLAVLLGALIVGAAYAISRSSSSGVVAAPAGESAPTVTIGSATQGPLTTTSTRPATTSTMTPTSTTTTAAPLATTSTSAPPPPTQPVTIATPPPTAATPAGGDTPLLGWAAMLGSLDSEASAQTEARKLSVALPGLRVARSADVPSLRPGYWVVYLGGLSSSDAALATCRSIGRTNRDACYASLFSNDPADRNARVYPD